MLTKKGSGSIDTSMIEIGNNKNTPLRCKWGNARFILRTAGRAGDWVLMLNIISVRRHLIRYLPSKVQFLIIYFFYLLTVQRVEAVNFSKHRVSCKTIKIKILKGHIVTRCLCFVCQYLKSVAHYFEAVIKFHWKRTNLGCVGVCTI